MASLRSVLLGLLLVVLAACSAGGEVAIADLVADGDRYEGKEVTVRGTVTAFDVGDGATHRHIVVEDVGHNRVELRPTGVAEPHVGASAEVTGIFTFDPGRGRAIDVVTITAE